ncbi:unnamed protein product [Diplocarpon coronariae]
MSMSIREEVVGFSKRTAPAQRISPRLQLRVLCASRDPSIPSGASHQPVEKILTLKSTDSNSSVRSKRPRHHVIDVGTIFPFPRARLTGSINKQAMC